jgi:nitrite reductase/ring-hydroxylating ferredoxin subunit
MKGKEAQEWREEFPYPWREDDLVTRRDTLRFLVGGTGALFLATGALAIIGNLPSGPNVQSVPVARVDELAENAWKVFDFPDEYAQGIAINLPGKGLVAYSDVCTHLSCAVLYAGDGKHLLPLPRGAVRCCHRRGAGRAADTPAAHHPACHPQRRDLRCQRGAPMSEIEDLHFGEAGEPQESSTQVRAGYQTEPADARPAHQAEQRQAANPDDPPVHRPSRGPHGPLPGPRELGSPGRIAIVQGQVFIVGAILVAQLWLVTDALYSLLSGHHQNLGWLALASGTGFVIALVVWVWPRHRTQGL